MKLSHSDVTIKAMELGLDYESACDLAFDLCPEFRMCTENQFNRAIAKLGV